MLIWASTVAEAQANPRQSSGSGSGFGFGYGFRRNLYIFSIIVILFFGFFTTFRFFYTYMDERVEFGLPLAVADAMVVAVRVGFLIR